MVSSVQHNNNYKILNGKDLIHSSIFLVSLTFRRKLSDLFPGVHFENHSHSHKTKTTVALNTFL